MAAAKASTSDLLIRALDRTPDEVWGWLNRPGTVWFDSAAPGAEARYSYLCIDPFTVLDDPAMPFDSVQAMLRQYGGATAPGPVPFTGGAAGFLGYDLGSPLERQVSRHTPMPGLPRSWFGFYDLVVAFDVQRSRCWAISSGLPETGAARARRAAARLDWLQQAWPDPPPRRATPPADWVPDLDRAAYCTHIARLLEYIQAGDIFQANFTMRFRAACPPGLCAAELYARLRQLSPAPFAAALNTGRAVLASASPERFLSLNDRREILAQPIKGTRKRGATAAQDDALAQDLARSEKDRAENLMIVDLLRNDLARVATGGSVQVPELCAVTRFPSVHHLVSTVQARLQPERDAVDLLRATFPGGSITGAPKIRAMQIIDELEQSARGPYCGSIAWLGFDGAMDSNIVIRTLVMTDTQLTAQAGGGIVADSDPDAEYDELMVKVQPLLHVLDPCA